MVPLLLASAFTDSFPASTHALVPGGILALMESAVRALIVASVVAGGLRFLAPRHVPAQRTAWGLVLAGALLMPVAAPWAGTGAWLPAGATWVVPTRAWAQFVLSRAAVLLPVKASLETPRAALIATPALAIEPRLASAASAPMDASVSGSAPSSARSF